MKLEQMLLDFQDDSLRTRKPRQAGITMVLVMDVANQGPRFIEPFQ